MGEFFKPRRRKVGVLTLVMACLFAAGWIRSIRLSEGVGFSRGTRTLDKYYPDQIYYCTDNKLYSEGGSLHWQHEFESQRKFSGAHPTFIWWSNPLDNTDPDDDDDEWLKWRWRFCGIRFGEIEDMTDEAVNELGKKVRVPRQRWYFLHVPYGAIVSPLTLVAFWLLLWNPRPSTVETIAAEVA